MTFITLHEIKATSEDAAFLNSSINNYLAAGERYLILSTAASAGVATSFFTAFL